MDAHKPLLTYGSEPSSRLRGRIRKLFEYRELLLNLVRKEIRTRYKESVLGFLWSMLNPILYLVVFWIVFNVFLPTAIPAFPVFLLAGLLPWTLFASSLGAGTNSIVGNGALLKKVYFPREVLPLASIGAGLFHFFLQMLVLMGFLVVFRYPFGSEYLALVVPALLTEILLLVGLVILLSAWTVYLRDISHFLELALLAWFWLTPIVYPVVLVFDKLEARGLFELYRFLNPMIPIVLSFQRAFYNQVTPELDGVPTPVLLDKPMSWYFGGLGVIAVSATVLIIIGFYVFSRLEGRFAEEL